MFVACHALGLQLAGWWPGARVPGPVWGLGLLWGAMCVAPQAAAGLDEAAALLLRYLPVFILPAGAGLMRLGLDRCGLAFAAACVAAWVSALWLTARLARSALRAPPAGEGGA